VLNTAQETPKCSKTGGLGNAIATYDPATMQFCYALSYSGLSQPIEMFSHIHAPGAIGVTGPVIITLPNTPNKAACVNVTKADEYTLFDELWYFNVHTSACPGGELRGQILMN
jgi:CHRD domain